MALTGFGLVKTTLLDYPGLVAAVVFTRGCNLRCPWCHNPAMVMGPPPPDLVSRETVMDHLRRRQRVLQGVVITGGEPLMHAGLVELMTEIKALGYQIKLDTNGTFPQRLADLPDGLVDFVAMDVKMAPDRYHLLHPLGSPVADKVRQAIEIIQRRWPVHEFRLTWVPGLNQPQDVPEIAALLGPDGLTLTGFRPGQTLDPDFCGRSPTPAELQAVVEQFAQHQVVARIR